MKRLTEAALRRPTLTLIVVGAISLAAAAGAVHLHSETGYRAALGASHPDVERLDRFIQDFGGGFPVVISWSCDSGSPCRDPLDDTSLSMAHQLTETLAAIPAVRRVLGPTTMPLFDAHGEARFLRPGVDSQLGLRALAVRDPLWSGTLVASDGGAAAIWMELASSDSERYASAVDGLLAALAPFEKEGFRFALVGDPIDFVIGGGELNEEPKKLSVVTVTVVFAVLWMLFGSLRAPLPAIATVGVAVLWTVGLMGWAGWPENEISQALVPLLLVVGVCDSLHFYSRFVGLDRESGTRRERLAASAGDVGLACTLTSLTTAAGFASFATSDLESFVRFGLTASFGVVAALGLTFTMLPVLVDKMHLEIDAPRTITAWQRALLLLLRSSESHSRAILVGAAVLTACAAVGISILKVDVSKETLMGSASQIVGWQRWLESHLRKPDTLEVRLTIPEGVVVSDPETFEALQKARSILEAHPSLGRTRSLLEPVARFNQVLHDGDESFFRPGDSGEQNEQLLFAIGAVDPSFLDRWLTVDRRHLRLSAEAELLPKSGRIGVVREISDELRTALPGWTIEVTGPLQLFGVMVDGIHSTQTRSFITAFLLISVLLAASLRSVSAATLVMVPTLFPVAVTLGAMGLAGVALDTGTAMIAAVLLGIAVDDGVHLVSRYQQERKLGTQPRQAMRTAIVEVGRPLVASSIALGLGFLSLLMSSWGAIASFGFLAAVTIAIALAADLLILPALLFAVVGPDHDDSYSPPTSGHRPAGKAGFLAVGAGVPIALVTMLILSGFQVLEDERTAVPNCVPAGSGVVLPSAALKPGCPFRILEVASGEVASSVELQPSTPTTRRAAHLLVSCVSLLILVLCSLVFWRSPTAAALPVLLASACLSGVLVGAVSGDSSPLASWAEVAALALAPGVAAHLALTFPVERAIIRAAPRIRILIYSTTLALGLTCLVGLGRFPELLALGLKIALFATLVAGLSVFVGCAIIAIRSDASALERGRARVLIFGMSGVTLVGVTAQTVGQEAAGAIPGEQAGVFALTCLLALLVVTFAVNRYGLFELETPSVRWVGWITQGVFVATCLVTFAWVLGPRSSSAGWAFAGAAVAWTALSVGRSSSLGALTAKRVNQMSLLSRIHAQSVRALPSRAALCGVSLSMIREGVGDPWGSIFLRSEIGWYLVDSSPDGGADIPLAELAAQTVQSRSVVHLLATGETGSHERLREAGVEVVAAVEAGGDLLGLVLLGPIGDAYSAADLAFVRTMAAQCAVALQWRQAADRLREIERVATRGYLAASMAHDLGKPIEVSWGIARSLLKRDGLGEEVIDGLERIQARSDDALAIVNRLLAPANPLQDRRAVGDVLGSAVEEIRSLYPHRIRMSLEPRLPRIASHAELRQVIVGVLENACLASPTDRAIEVVGSTSTEGILLDVTDQGCGMSAETARRAFELWFTTRLGDGGRGLGLGLCRSLISQIGGSVSIASTRLGYGTTIRVVVPETGQ